MIALQSLRAQSVVEGVGAGSESAPPKVLVCQKFGQDLKIFEHRNFDIF